MTASGQAHLFKTYIMMLIVMDLIISISLAIKLMGLRSSMKSSDKAIHFMVRNLFGEFRVQSRCFVLLITVRVSLDPHQTFNRIFSVQRHLDSLFDRHFRVSS